MCLIIYKPAKLEIPKDIIKKAWINNKDGAGFVASLGKDFYFAKGFFSEKTLLKEIKSFKHCELAIHLRLATHGAVNPTNCHPFVIDSRKVKRTNGKAVSLLMHNGIISAYGDENNSDSWHFAREALAPLSLAARDRMLRAMPGKFVLAEHGKFYLYGLDKHDATGCFVSNKSWMFEHSNNFGIYPSINRYNSKNYSLIDTPAIEPARTIPDVMNLWNPNTWEDN